MKKIFLSLLIISAFALTTVVNVKTANADIDPDCPNGCIAKDFKGCYCYEFYWYLDEYEW